MSALILVRFRGFVLATLLAGAAPSWLASHRQPAEVLHSESRLASEPRTTKLHDHDRVKIIARRYHKTTI